MGPVELPDIYEVRMGRLAGRAIAQGDLEYAERLRQHIVAESATDAGEEAMLDEVSRGAMLFRQASEASDRGDKAESERLMTELRATCSRATQEMLVASALMTVGAKQGWLPAADHDYLTGYVQESGFGSDVRAVIETIERRPARS